MIGKDDIKAIRALVVDDSAYNRQAIAEMIESSGEIEVVGLAANGEEGLKAALELKPDVITLDLEMPKMDGFTFLRILMSRQATPVIVISSYSRKQNVFKALELGALDFIAKPTRYLSPELHKIKKELIEKIQMVRHLQTGGLRLHVESQKTVTKPRAETTDKRETLPDFAVIAIGASTGGPPALQNLMQAVSPAIPAAFLVVQHMPENFTAAFADRLNRYTGLVVREAQGGEIIEPNRVFISPGGRNMALVREGSRLRVRIVDPIEGAKYTPSIDTLFQSAAKLAGKRVLGILLTGMGSDGKKGIAAIKAAGGKTIAEAEETAVIFGMPKEAIETGHIDLVCRLDEIAAEATAFAEEVSGSGTGIERPKRL